MKSAKWDESVVLIRFLINSPTPTKHSYVMAITHTLTCHHLYLPTTLLCFQSSGLQYVLLVCSSLALSLWPLAHLMAPSVWSQWDGWANSFIVAAFCLWVTGYPRCYTTGYIVLAGFYKRAFVSSDKPQLSESLSILPWQNDRPSVCLLPPTSARLLLSVRPVVTNSVPFPTLALPWLTGPEQYVIQMLDVCKWNHFSTESLFSLLMLQVNR